MKKHTCLSVIILLSTILNAQGPEVTSWIVNVTGATNPSYTFYESNVQSVDYNSTDVYVSCTCIPGYDIGPWTANPNTPSNQNFCFRINRNPQENTGTKTETPMGHIGVWSNGVSIFNAKDGMSYNNGNIWYQDALYFEGISFDDCLGHPAQNGEYHHHVNPTCLYDDNDDQNHSPIIGYAFDHFPIYFEYFSCINRHLPRPPPSFRAPRQHATARGNALHSLSQYENIMIWELDGVSVHFLLR